MRSAVIAAIKWAAENKAKVVNLSLGFQDDEADNAELCKTIADLKDISFFAAAGIAARKYGVSRGVRVAQHDRVGCPRHGADMDRSSCRAMAALA